MSDSRFDSELRRVLLSDELRDELEAFDSREVAPPTSAPVAKQEVPAIEVQQRHARYSLFALGACVPHAEIDLEKAGAWMRKAVGRLDAPTLEALRELPLGEALAAWLSATCAALYVPCRFVGGCDAARGFEKPGNEWPQLAALIKGRDSYCDRYVSRCFSAWETDGTGFRKQALEDTPITCRRSGKVYARRYIRNRVYVAARELARWQGVEWVRGLSVALRATAPTWAWIASDRARSWRRGLTYADTLTSSRDDLKQARERAERRRSGRRRSPRGPITPIPSGDQCRKDGPAARVPAGASLGPGDSDGAGVGRGAPSVPPREPEEKGATRGTGTNRASARARGAATTTTGEGGAGLPWAKFLAGGGAERGGDRTPVRGREDGGERDRCARGDHVPVDPVGPLPDEAPWTKWARGPRRPGH